jgi:hypothetical protein
MQHVCPKCGYYKGREVIQVDKTPDPEYRALEAARVRRLAGRVLPLNGFLSG